VRAARGFGASDQYLLRAISFRNFESAYDASNDLVPQVRAGEMTCRSWACVPEPVRVGETAGPICNNTAY